MERTEAESWDVIHVHKDAAEKVRNCLPAEEELLELSGFFKVFGDATRIKILCILLQSEMCVCDLAQTLNELGQEVIFLGDGVPVYQEQLAQLLEIPYSFAPAHLNRQRAGAVGALAAIYYREGKCQPAEEMEPEYLRKSQAEREREEREVKP